MEAGNSYTYEEAIILIQGLLAMTDSLYNMRIKEWTYPLSRTDIILSDFIDLFMQANSTTKPAPYHRPFELDDGSKFLKGSPMTWERSQEVYGFKSELSETEIIKRNEEYIKKNGSLQNIISKQKD